MVAILPYNKRNNIPIQEEQPVVKRPRGRPCKQITDVQVKELVCKGYTFKEITEELGCSISYFVKVWAERAWIWRSELQNNI